MSLPPPAVPSQPEGHALPDEAGQRVTLDLDAHAEHIRSLWRRSVEAFLDIGRELAKVKSSLPHGGFTHWVETELPFGVRQAERFMRIAANPVLTNPTHASRLPASSESLYLLSSLPHEKLELGLASGDVQPDMSRKAITALAGTTRGGSKTIESLPVSAEAERRDRARAAALDWQASFGDIPEFAGIVAAIDAVFGGSQAGEDHPHQNGDRPAWRCTSCDETIDESDLVSVRECSWDPCGAIFAAIEGKNCPDCNRPFTRLVHEHGCPECGSEDECEEVTASGRA